MATVSPRAYSVISGVILGIGVTLTTATSLRFSGIPFGPGEMTLLAWSSVSVLGAVLTASRRRSRALPLPAWILTSVLLTVAALLAGSLTHSLLFGELANGAGRTTVAFAFVIALGAIIGLHRDPATVLRASLSAIVVSAAAISCGILFGMVSGEQVAGRLSGLSVNPNQLALLLIPVPFMALSRQILPIPFVFRVGIVAIVVVVGVTTGSDALLLAWMMSSFALTIARARASALNTFSTGILVAVVIIGLIGVYGLAPIPELRHATVAMYEAGNQGQDRIELWMNGIGAGLKSPLWGLGPGAHSGFSMPHQGVEAHNTIIDWFTMTGLVGLVALLVPMGKLHALILRERRFLMLGVLTALVVFSMFHFVLRHPLVIVVVLGIHVSTREAGNQL